MHPAFSLACNVVTLCGCLLLVPRWQSGHGASGENVTVFKEDVSWKKAFDVCSSNGLSFSDYPDDDHRLLNTSEILLQLKNGESAWIPGRSRLSPWLSWYGCSTTHLDELIGNVLSRNSVSQCSRFCNASSSPSQFIGIREQFCYCNITANSTVLTIRTCIRPNVTGHRDFCCDQNNSISIYNMHSTNEGRVVNGAGSYSIALGQCAFVSNVSGNIILKADNCVNPRSRKHGYLCQRPSQAGCTGMWTRIGTIDACWYSLDGQNNESWYVALKGCMARESRLMSDLNITSTTDVLPEGLSMWTGLFRSFDFPTSALDVREPDTVCVVLTRCGTEVKMESRDCNTTAFTVCTSSDSASEAALAIELTTEDSFENSSSHSYTDNTEIIELTTEDSFENSSIHSYTGNKEITVEGKEQDSRLLITLLGTIGSTFCVIFLLVFIRLCAKRTHCVSMPPETEDTPVIAAFSSHNWKGSSCASLNNEGQTNGPVLGRMCKGSTLRVYRPEPNSVIRLTDIRVEDSLPRHPCPQLERRVVSMTTTPKKPPRGNKPTSLMVQTHACTMNVRYVVDPTTKIDETGSVENSSFVAYGSHCITSSEESICDVCSDDSSQMNDDSYVQINLLF